MSEKTSPKPEPRGLDRRPSSSRKLLSRKARERAPVARDTSLESCFPPAVPVDTKPNTVGSEAGDDTAPASATAAATTPQRPNSGRKSDPRLRPGDVSPNPGTIVAAILRLVVERGEVSRTELIDLMTDASLAHPKARPAEKGWSQGYVAGAIRSGFLAVAGESSTAAHCRAPGEEGQPC